MGDPAPQLAAVPPVDSPADPPRPEPAPRRVSSSPVSMEDVAEVERGIRDELNRLRSRVDELDGEDDPPPAAGASSPPRRSSFWPIVLGLVLVLAAVALGLERRRESGA